MFNKPQDLAVMIGIFGLVMITFGFGLNSVMNFYDNENVTVQDQELNFFNKQTNLMNSSLYLKGAADDYSESMTGGEGQDASTTEESIVKQGFNSLLALGQTYKAAESSITEGSKIIGLDPLYFLVISAIIIISFGVVIYTWIRVGT